MQFIFDIHLILISIYWVWFLSFFHFCSQNYKLKHGQSQFRTTHKPLNNVFFSFLYFPDKNPHWAIPIRFCRFRLWFVIFSVFDDLEKSKNEQFCVFLSTKIMNKKWIRRQKRFVCVYYLFDKADYYSNG